MSPRWFARLPWWRRRLWFSPVVVERLLREQRRAEVWDRRK